MTVTLPILCDRFNRFNERIFGGRLPRIPLRVSSAATRAGSFSHRTSRSRSGIVHTRSISISSAFDLEPDALDDVIIHEMIHYWIDLYGPRETPHGPAFRAMMEEINRTHGRYISIRLSATPEASRKPRFVGVMELPDGRIGIVVPARSRLAAMYRDIPRLFGAVNCRWYVSSDGYFARFPSALKPKLYIPDPGSLKEALAGARGFTISSDRLIMSSSS